VSRALALLNARRRSLIVIWASASNKGRPVTSESNHGDRQHGLRWWILVLVAVAQLMVVLDATIVNIALPSAQRGLHFSDSERQWIVTA
jgi:hypothetical protein